MKSLESPENQERLKKIRILILDVDGILTDGKIFWVKDQGWTRSFHVLDGYGIRLMMKVGLQVAVFTGSDTQDIHERMRVLKIQHAYLGNENKIQSLDHLIATTGLSLDQMAFMGDELFDIPVLKKVGFSATVPHATEPVQKSVHYTTRATGGNGAVREVIDAIFKAQNLSVVE